jgi:gluconate 5-dehydrogenase
MGVMDLLRLDSRVAIVTGGSRGLGRQIAEGLGEAGATLAITARKEAGLAEAAADLRTRGISCLAVPCDITNPDDVQAMVDRVVAELGGVDILVNNGRPL